MLTAQTGKGRLVRNETIQGEVDQRNRAAPFAKKVGILKQENIEEFRCRGNNKFLGVALDVCNRNATIEICEIKQVSRACRNDIFAKPCAKDGVSFIARNDVYVEIVFFQPAAEGNDCSFIRATEDQECLCVVLNAFCQV